MTHARLSPSNYRWVHCPASVEAESDYPDIANKAGIDGTGSHKLLELCLLNNYKPESFLGTTIEEGEYTWHVDQDRIDRVNMCINYIERRKKELKNLYPDCSIDVKSEQKVNPGKIFDRDDWYGTCDVQITVIDEQWRIILVEVVDYKDGRLYVPAEDNSQLVAYAFGSVQHLLNDKLEYKIRDWDFNIRISIVQPKSSTPVRYHDMKLSSLVSKATQLNQAAKRTDDDGAPFVPDERDGKGHCRWCKHRDNCAALKAKKAEKIKMIPVQQGGGGGLLELLGSSNEMIQTLDNDKLSELLDAKAAIEGIFATVEEEVRSRIEAGQEVSGYGMVPGRMSRVWNISEEKVVEVLRNRRVPVAKIYTKKLVSPAQALKLQGLTGEQRERIERDFISQKFGEMKLGKVERKLSVDQMFEELPETISFL